MGFLKMILSKKELSIEDLSYLNRLLDTNLSLNQCLELLNTKSNEYVFNAIIKSLDEGKMIEDIIGDYLPRSIKTYMLPLLSKISFNKALSLSLDFYDKNKETENKLLSKIAYPCILLFVTITALYLFDLYGIDTIFSLIGGLNTNLELFQRIRIVFRVIINIFYYGILFVVLFIVLYSRPNKITLLYIFVSRNMPNTLLNLYYSEEFVELLLICVDKGYKTKEALQILMEMKSKPIISFLAFHLDEALLEGESLKDAAKNLYYDSALSRFIKIANYTNEFSKTLTNYTNLTREKINRKIQKYTVTIQISTYGFIGVIVIFIYEILFLPMQALSTY